MKKMFLVFLSIISLITLGSSDYSKKELTTYSCFLSSESVNRISILSVSFMEVSKLGIADAVIHDYHSAPLFLRNAAIEIARDYLLDIGPPEIVLT